MFWESYDTSPELFPEDQPWHTHVNALNSNETVDGVTEPTHFDAQAYVYAVRSYLDFERYGFPYEGGYMVQPWVWKLALDTVKDALNAAEAEARAEKREREREREQKG